VADVAAALGARCRATRPSLALILGSGLGGFGRHIECATRVPFAQIPGFIGPTVAGHEGELVHGILGGREILAFVGRLHLYEGHSTDAVTRPVRLAHAMGARTLFVTNAAGGIRPGLRPGTLMIIRDHINWMSRNPLIGPLRPGDLRFPDMSAPYDRPLGDAFAVAAEAAGAVVADGVYAGVLGPSYETPAEVRMLAGLGADAVGMSTVPEVIVARALGMRVVGVSCITNAASGVTSAKLSHSEVLAVTAQVGPTFEHATRRWVLERADDQQG
jgi:purine-nucleoside phosphorylase